MPCADDRVWLTDATGGRRSVPLGAYLDAAAREAAEREANAWIKGLRHARVDGLALRDRLTYRGDSLWWFVELYLHKQRTAASLHRTISALETIVRQERPAEIQAAGDAPLLALLVPQVAARHGVRAASRFGAARWRRRLRLHAQSRFHRLTALADRLRPAAGAMPEGGVEVAAFVHSAFWRRDRAEEGYVGPVLRALEERLPGGRLALVGLGPRTNFRIRRWRHRFAEFNDPRARTLPLVPIEMLAGRRAIRPSLAIWRDRHRTLRALEESVELRRAALIGGYDAWPVVRDDLLGVSHLQLPWSARSMDEAGAALDALRPRVVLTYAEAGGWGRALTLEARRRGIPVAGLQHGFIYRHWLNYLHEPDEMVPSPANAGDAGFPCPDLTLVYDGFTRQHLVDAGHFPPSAVAITGSARLEAFVQAGQRLGEADRRQIRGQAGANPGEQLVVLATKFTEIGPWFQALVDAIRTLPDARLVVKCHPAEGPEPYERVAASAGNVRVLGAQTDLSALVACADLIVTVNSTAAIEAMSLDVPALVLALPNNLSPVVECGAMAGVERFDEIGAALRRVLYDRQARHQIDEARRAFVERYQVISSGGAASRAADAILRLADAPAAPSS